MGRGEDINDLYVRLVILELDKFDRKHVKNPINLTLRSKFWIMNVLDTSYHGDTNMCYLW